MIVKCWKSEFKVYRELLIQDSEIFRTALQGTNDDGQPAEIDLGEEFRSSEFGVYVDVLYRSYFVDDFRLRREHIGRYQPLIRTLSLWKLANRFKNDRITAVATESIMFQLSVFDTEWWERVYLVKPDEGMLVIVKSFEKAVLKCEAEDLPFSDHIIQACSNMPPQVYQQHLDKLVQGFGKELSKRLTMRFANPTLHHPVKRSRSETPTEDGNFPSGDNTVIELD